MHASFVARYLDLETQCTDMRESTQELDTTARYVESHTKIKTTSSITNANLDLDPGVGGKKESRGRSKHSRVMCVGIFIRTMSLLRITSTSFIMVRGTFLVTSVENFSPGTEL